MATIKGVWVFNEALTKPDSDIKQAVNFTYNNSPFYDRTSWAGFRIYGSPPNLMMAYDGVINNGQSPYGSSGWGEGYSRVVDFGKTEQTVSDEFYNWFIANARQQMSEESQSITIAYDGTVIKTIEAGQIARMPCAGKGMESDVVVSFGTDGYIYYDGVKKYYQAGQVARIVCEGKKMKTDITVETEQLAGVWLLNTEYFSKGYGSFEVDGIGYTAYGDAFSFDGLYFVYSSGANPSSYVFAKSPVVVGEYFNKYSIDSTRYIDSFMYTKSDGSNTQIGGVRLEEAAEERFRLARTLVINTRYSELYSPLMSLLKWLKANAVKIG